MKAVPTTTETLTAILEDMLTHVRTHDSFEGSLSYWMPEPAMECDRAAFKDGEWVLLSGESEMRWSCPECGMTTASRQDLERQHDGDPLTTAAGEPNEFMVTGNFRVGNSLGQGGMVIIGRVE